MRLSICLILLSAICGAAWSAPILKPAAEHEVSVGAHIETEALKNELSDLFAGKTSNWDLFDRRAQILRDSDPEAFSALAGHAVELYVDRFGIYEMVAPKLSANDKIVLSKLWESFPGLLDDKLYRSLADRPSQKDMAALLQAYEAALTEDASKRIPVFDVHFHYYPNDPERNLFSDPGQIVALLRHYNVRGALLSGVPNEQVRRLYNLAPDLFVPEVMPNIHVRNHDYARSDIYNWADKERILAMVHRWVATKRMPLAGIGEAHITAETLDQPGFLEMAKLAAENDLFLHLHTDITKLESGIRKLFREIGRDAKVLLAHGGFRGIDAPTKSPEADAIGELLERYPNLHTELAAREDLWSNGKLERGWKRLLIAKPERVMIGTDPYLRFRWEFYGAFLYRMREWLDTLPREVAESVAFRNAERLFRPYAQAAAR